MNCRCFRTSLRNHAQANSSPACPHLGPWPGYAPPLQYASLATQIGTVQQAEAPRRTIKAQSPAIKKVKRKAALPPEARGQGRCEGEALKQNGAEAELRRHAYVARVWSPHVLAD